MCLLIGTTSHHHVGPPVFRSDVWDGVLGMEGGAGFALLSCVSLVFKATERSPPSALSATDYTLQNSPHKQQGVCIYLFPGLHSGQGLCCLQRWNVDSEYMIKKGSMWWVTFVANKATGGGPPLPCFAPGLPRPRTPFDPPREVYTSAMWFQTQATRGELSWVVAAHLGVQIFGGVAVIYRKAQDDFCACAHSPAFTHAMKDC
eukprot:EG_transcript_19520